MTFNADLHVHSRYSRATSMEMDLEHLYVAAQIKGVRLVGTGDFTHPRWFDELKEKLVLDENGLFRLRPDIADACDRNVPGPCRQPVRFVLQSEISNIYKKNDRTRKNHNLVYLPDFDAADRFNRTLARLGNIHSDGRPILGLDARDLLEIVLETTPRGMLIPAHIWTPWFSMLGSKSGFDSVAACFEDLTEHVYAVETGLSSDPPMNWRVSDLDGMTLVSNSDAHSPAKIGREATVFNCDLSYDGVFDAIRTGDPDRFCGTLEFYPEEGKYHLDGHRKCEVRLTPGESLALDNRCPVCGKEMTLGVFHRVVALSDRPSNQRPEKKHDFKNMVSLDHILAEIFKVGAGTKTVREQYGIIMAELGSELTVLLQHPIVAIEKLGVPLLGEAIERVRSGNLHINGGYDGVFGTISIFTDEERAMLQGQQRLFCIPDTPRTTPCKSSESEFLIPQPQQKGSVKTDCTGGENARDAGLNDAQNTAVTHDGGPLIIVAGPGTGKTLTLTHRVAHLIRRQGVSPQAILAVTFTNKAAAEMTQRLTCLLTDLETGQHPLVATFHAFCHHLLYENAHRPFSIIADEDRPSLIAAAISMTPGAESAFGKKGATDVLKLIIRAKQRLMGPEDDLSDLVSSERKTVFCGVYEKYQEFLELQQLLDFEDLIRLVVTRLEADPSFRQRLQTRFTHVLVDEYQDINHGQYRLIRALCPPRSALCVIGDPDQSIYGFRGSNYLYFHKFTDDYPDAAVVRLTYNYRSQEAIISAAYDVVEKQETPIQRRRPEAMVSGQQPVTIVQSETDRSEAVAIGKTIERLVGGTGFQSVDFGVVDGDDGDGSLGFSDMAVLVRTRRQGDIIQEVLAEGGIPCRQVTRSRFMGDRVISSILSLLRLVAGIGGVADLSRVKSVIEPGISPATMRTVTAWCFENALSVNTLRYSVRRYPITGLTQQRQQRLYDFLGVPFVLRQETMGRTVVDTIRHIVDRSRLKRAVRNEPGSKAAYEDLLQMAGGFDTDIDGFITSVMLHTDTDQFSKAAQKVSIMTVHAAKGLEFQVVFVSGCNDGLLPLHPAHGSEPDLDEERRIFFVAATRAMNRLYLCHAPNRLHHGRQHGFLPSPFLNDIDVQKTSLMARHRKSPSKPVQEQLSLF